MKSDDGEHDHGDGIDQIGCAKFAQGFRIEGVAAVGEDSEGCDDPKGQIQFGEIIVFEDRTGDGFVSVGSQFVSSFAESKIEGQGEGAGENPTRDVHIDHGGTDHDAQEETAGDQGDIEVGDAFEAETVSEIDGEVQSGDGCGDPGEEGGDEQAQSRQDGPQIPGQFFWKSSAGDGAKFFVRVFSILFDVHEIVENVHTSAQQAETEKRECAACDGMKIREFQGEQQWGKDQGIFGPLVGSHGDQNGFECGHHVCFVALFFAGLNDLLCTFGSEQKPEDILEGVGSRLFVSGGNGWMCESLWRDRP